MPKSIHGWQSLLPMGLVSVCFGLAVAAYASITITVFAPVMMSVGPSGVNAVGLIFMAVTVLGMYAFNDVLFRPSLWRWMLLSFSTSSVSVLMSIATRRDASAYIDPSYFNSQTNIWLATSVALFTILSNPLAHYRKKMRLSPSRNHDREKPHASGKKDARDNQ